MVAGRVAPEEKAETLKSEKLKAETLEENFKPQSSTGAGARWSNQRLARREREWERPNQITQIDTDKEATAELRPGSRAGASESDSLTSKLADSPVSDSLTRSASIPASIPASSHLLPATAPEALVGGAGELVAAMCRVAARSGVARYHRWSGLPFLWDEEWI